MSNRNKAATAVSFNLGLIVAVLALTGCMLVVFGCLFEGQAQLDLLHTGGPAALDAYVARAASHQLSFAAFMVESVTGHCYARGAFLQGVGFWFVFVLTPLAAGLSSLARWFSARERTTDLRLRMAVVR